MEEKEKECTGRDQCGAHTPIQSLSLFLSERVSLAHSLAHTPGAQERAGSRAARKSCTGFYSGLNCFGKCVCSVKSTEPAESCPPGSAPGNSGPPPRPGLSLDSATIAAATASEAPRPGACEGLGTLAGLPPLDAWPAWFSCTTVQERL